MQKIHLGEEELIKQKQTLLAAFKILEQSKGWTQFNTKPCKMFKMTIDTRIASKGEATAQGDLKQFAQMIDLDQFNLKLDKQLKSIKPVYNQNGVVVNLFTFHGIFPVSARDFVMLENKIFENDGKKYYNISKSVEYDCPEQKSIVRGWCHIGGYVAEQVDEKTIKVTYISDADPKGMIPDFVKNKLSTYQGEIASRVDGELKEWRKKFKK